MLIILYSRTFFFLCALFIKRILLSSGPVLLGQTMIVRNVDMAVHVL